MWHVRDHPINYEHTDTFNTKFRTFYYYYSLVEPSNCLFIVLCDFITENI